MYRNVLFPLLTSLDAEWTHDRTLSLLAAAQRVSIGRLILRFLAGELPEMPVEILGLRFPNPIGVAAGFDKDVRVGRGLSHLGFGHVEVGTLTPRPQQGNPRPRVFRLPVDGALINRMGFPNVGVEAALPRLKSLWRNKGDLIVGVSLGKQRETPLADAVSDYLSVMQAVYAYSDYLVINVSSPNTPGLRELQNEIYLTALLEEVQARARDMAGRHGIAQRPVLVKIAPDLRWAELDTVIESVDRARVSGIIATNTTLNHDNLRDKARVEEGGVSGIPLRQRSTEIISYIHRQTNGRLPIIGVGGVRTAKDVESKLDTGASLVQMYTGLIYEGPRVAGRILRELRG